MPFISNGFDLFVLLLAVIGLILTIVELHLYDWNIKELMFVEKKETMKKAENICELSVGQKIYTDINTARKEYIIRSIEDKLVPYIIATDNSSHSLYSGIWVDEKKEVS